MRKRKLYDRLLKESKTDKISIIIGPRQVGKTTLLRQLHEELGGLFVDLDILENAEKFETYTKALQYLKVEGYDENEPFFVFFDEFQKYKDISLVLKNLYDNHKNIKMYATGSSSLRIKDEIQESLAGRKFLHTLLPLDFEEFLFFKNHDMKRFERVKNSGLGVQKDYLILLEEFMIYGGYPEVVTSKDKTDILRSIFDTYIKKDLVDFLSSSEVLGMKKLIQYLAINNANKLNLLDISNQLALSRHKLEGYLQILEETYIIHRLVPYFKNKNKEIVKAFKEFFIDTGVRNYFCNNFNHLMKREDSGFLFESFVTSEIKKNSEYDVKFFDDIKKHEVDIVVDKVSSQIALEVKYKKEIKSSDFRGLEAIGNNIENKYIVSLGNQTAHTLSPFLVPDLFR